MGGKRRDKDNTLSQKEKHFVTLVTKGDVGGKPISAAEAYRRAIDGNVTPGQATSRAAYLRRKPHVAQAIARCKIRANIETENATKATAGQVRDRLWEEATRGERATERIAALRELRQLSQTEENVTNLDALSREELIATLREQLSHSLGISTIELMNVRSPGDWGETPTPLSRGDGPESHTHGSRDNPTQKNEIVSYGDPDPSFTELPGEDIIDVDFEDASEKFQNFEIENAPQLETAPDILQAVQEAETETAPPSEDDEAAEEPLPDY